MYRGSWLFRWLLFSFSLILINFSPFIAIYFVWQLFSNEQNSLSITHRFKGREDFVPIFIIYQILRQLITFFLNFLFIRKYFFLSLFHFSPKKSKDFSKIFFWMTFRSEICGTDLLLSSSGMSLMLSVFSRISGTSLQNEF